jgi:formylglycine-generating enzyme required for sulfatase activity
MSRYETTNAQYCQFLNAAKASGDITVTSSVVFGAEGSNPGADFDGERYYDLAGAGLTYDGVTNGGAARINWTGNSFTVDAGFENHPVTYVSWYGSTAFANYYGWRLPTEWEWQAVADYNGTFTYGCGTSINNNMANYIGSTHPYGTTPVGAFGTYGYGMADLAGNVLEWTSSCYFQDCAWDYRVLRGASWGYSRGYCEVSIRYYGPQSVMDSNYGSLGFRVCN